MNKGPPWLQHPRKSLNLIHERDFVTVRFEPLGYPGRLPHVLGCFLVPKHGLKRLSTSPLCVVGNLRTIEAPVDVRRDEPRLFAHYCLGGLDQHVHQTLLMPWFNGEDVSTELGSNPPSIACRVFHPGAAVGIAFPLLRLIDRKTPSVEGPLV